MSLFAHPAGRAPATPASRTDRRLSAAKQPLETFDAYFPRAPSALDPSKVRMPACARSHGSAAPCRASGGDSGGAARSTFDPSRRPRAPLIDPKQSSTAEASMPPRSTASAHVSTGARAARSIAVLLWPKRLLERRVLSTSASSLQLRRETAAPGRSNRTLTRDASSTSPIGPRPPSPRSSRALFYTPRGTLRAQLRSAWTSRDHGVPILGPRSRASHRQSAAGCSAPVHDAAAQSSPCSSLRPTMRCRTPGHIHVVFSRSLSAITASSAARRGGS